MWEMGINLRNRLSFFLERDQEEPEAPYKMGSFLVFLRIGLALQ